MDSEEFEKKLAGLPQEVKDVVDACCKQRDEILERVAKVGFRLKTLAESIENGVLPNPEVNESAKRGARRVMTTCRDAEEMLHELVTALAHADAISAAYMDAVSGDSKLQ